MLKRSFNAKHIYDILSHEKVAPWTHFEGKSLDFVSAIVGNPNNICLFCDSGGFIFIDMGAGVYEAHTQFLPNDGDRSVLELAQDAAMYLFSKTPCVKIITSKFTENKAISALIDEMSFKFKGGTPERQYYELSFDDWVLSTERLFKTGAAFHDKLGDEKDHDDSDSAHDYYAGMVYVLAKNGHLAKGVHFYNEWCKMSGFAPLFVESTLPPVVSDRSGFIWGM